MYKKMHINDFRLFHDQTLMFGKYLTVLSGRNSTGKSTILGMIANSGELKKKDGLTYSSRQFRAEFSELFKGSRRFDRVGADKFTIVLSDESGDEVDYRSFRTAWQKKDKRCKKLQNKDDDNNVLQNEVNAVKSGGEREEGVRFRVIPFKKLPDGKKTEAKFTYPVLYLGLSRLFPIGESNDGSISTKGVVFKSESQKEWFTKNYRNILSMHSELREVTNYSLAETDKKIGIGISTDQYDYLTNSSGQDNLGQILLALLSFRNLKEAKGGQWKGGILLIDEVDATLHPAAQSRLIQLFIQEARSNQLQIVLTTHSLSLLKDICRRTSNNDYNEEVNNNVELYYLTNANRRLEIKRNPPFTEIESDLTVLSVVQTGNKIKLYSEDSEARWVLSRLIPEYLPYVEVLDVTIGCMELINLYKADLQYFSNVLLVFDGDVTESSFDKIPKLARTNFGNVLRLPGGKRPEQVIYEYLRSLGPDHEYWEGKANRLGFSWDYFEEHGPLSEDYERLSEREKYKEWFTGHQQYFDATKLMDYWMHDNSSLVKEFRRSFKEAHNHIAKRMMTYMID